MTILDDFIARFPEFPEEQAAQYVPILENVWQCYYAGSYVNACEHEIILNLIAHMMTTEISAGSANAGVIQSKSVGSVSVSYAAGYAATSERNAWLASTKYGLRYLLLTRARQGGVFV
ncbi:MAG: DUF4054 domain-containing protein [Methyloprofundus sp.]|nr:DUF4054 domain-containing protein [Methyloprofundus sp.]